VHGVRAHPQRLAGIAPGVAGTNAALKRFLHRHVYDSDELAQERSESVSQVAWLFDYYMRNPLALPERSPGDPLYRVVCDYIAGMTDRYFHRVYLALHD
jgi:dGTPase